MGSQPSPFYVIAHRGASDRAPENTFAAFDLAAGAGAHELETDVRVTRDGMAVLFHDASLQRIAGDPRAIEALSLEEAQGLDAGRHFSAEFSGQHIPTLEAFLDRYLARIPLQLELKSAESADFVVNEIVRRNALGRILVTSFERDYLQQALALEGRVKCGWLISTKTEIGAAEVKALGCMAIMPHASKLTAQSVAAAHAAGLVVRAWGVKSLALARQVISSGADGCTYNDPADLLRVLKEGGADVARALPPMALGI